MANKDHVEILLKGAEAWNTWRKKNSHIKPDLSDFYDRRYDGKREGYIPQPFNNSHIELGEHEHGYKTDYRDYDLSNSILDNIDFRKQDLNEVSLVGASMKGCDLENQYLIDKDLQNVNLAGANLKKTRIIGANFSDSNLKGVDFRNSLINQCNLGGCDLSESKVYGVAVWDVNLENSVQKDIVITKEDQAEITVDNLKVAQFVYLIINYSEIRDVIDTLTSKAVLILGRFTNERLKVLYSIKDLLRDHGYLPIIFDFDVPDNRDETETVITLASISKFIIADLSEPKSVPHELANFIKDFEVPLMPIIAKEVNGEEHYEYSMFRNLKKYPWVHAIYRYEDEETLITELEEKIIKPADSYKLIKNFTDKFVSPCSSH